LLDWPLTPLGELVLVLKYKETARASTEDNTSPRKYYNWPLTPLGELVLTQGQAQKEKPAPNNC
jgi:hypothetical protein